MKMIAGAASLALANRSRTREAPTPTIASMNSEAEIEKNAACASPATARASSVLPVPARPTAARRGASARRGARSGPGRAGSRRSPVSSALASSIPATSSNVTRIFCGSTRRACERPKLPSAPMPRRRTWRAAREQHEQADDQQRRAEAEQQLGEQRPAFGFVDLALTSTPFSCSSADIALGSGAQVVERRQIALTNRIPVSGRSTIPFKRLANILWHSFAVLI